MRYTSSITAGSLKLPESRAVAAVLLQGRGEADAASASTPPGWQQARAKLAAELAARGLTDAGLTAACLGPLDHLTASLEREQSLAHLAQTRGFAEEKLDLALARIEEFLKAKAERDNTPTPPAAKPRHPLRPADLDRGQRIQIL